MTDDHTHRGDDVHPVEAADDDWDDEPCPDHCEDKVPLGGYYHCHVCDREWLDVDDDLDDLPAAPTEGE
jgi:hypothetical protein